METTPWLRPATCDAWGQVVRFIPALVVSPKEIAEAASIWSDAVSAVAG